MFLTRQQSTAQLQRLKHGRPHRIRGWAAVRTKTSRITQRRYMKLHHYLLTITETPTDPTNDVFLEQVMTGAQVSNTSYKKEIIIRFANDKLTVNLRTDKEYHAWLTALTDATYTFQQFYTIRMDCKLGTGAFSTVYFCFDSNLGDHAAVKLIDKKQCSRAELQYSDTEARMMAFVQHQCIIPCLDIFDSPDTLHVVMTLMNGSTLEQRMLSLPPAVRRFSEPIAATVMSRLLNALSYLEEKGICHRDVKPDNILLDTLPNDTLWPTTAKLSDFGLAAFIKSDNDLFDIVGTPNYVAPEIITRDDQFDDERPGYGCPVDVWASGIILFWMLTGGYLPFDGCDSATIFKQIRKGQLDLSNDLWTSVSLPAKDFLKSLLHSNPQTRLRASSACCHPWLLLAHQPLETTLIANRQESNISRKSLLSMRSRLRVIFFSTIAIIGFMRAGEPPSVKRARLVRRRMEKTEMERIARMEAQQQKEEKFLRSTERAPVGADGLAYNIGLLPSFNAKRRLRASTSGNGRRKPDDIPTSRNSPTSSIGNNVAAGISDIGSRFRSIRISTESASGSSGSGSHSVLGMDQSNIGQRFTAGPKGVMKGPAPWPIKLRGRSFDRDRDREWDRERRGGSRR